MTRINRLIVRTTFAIVASMWCGGPLLAQLNKVVKFNTGFYNHNVTDLSSAITLKDNRKFTVCNQIELLLQKKINSHISVTVGGCYLRNPVLLSAILVNGVDLGDMKYVNHCYGIPLYLHYFGGKRKQFMAALGVEQMVYFLSHYRVTSYDQVTRLVYNQFDFFPFKNALAEIGYNHTMVNKNELQFTFRTAFNLTWINTSFYRNKHEYIASICVAYVFTAHEKVK